jgi:TonB family protein
MEYIKQHKKGILGTLITHVVVLFFLLFFGFFTPLPLPGEEGILVNFGDSETGFGLEEPAPQESAPQQTQTEEKIEKKLPKPEKLPAPSEKEALMTQDLEKTAAIETAKKKKEADKADALEKEKISKEKLEKEQKEKQLLAQAEAEKRKANEISDRAKNAFGASGKGTSTSQSTSQGVTFGTGNQGSTQGTANADKYGSGGGIGNGVSFSLDGRSALSLPEPESPGNEYGKVVVKVKVDQSGKVTEAEAGVQGSNILKPDWLAAARKAALQARFKVAEDAPVSQVGTITYTFNVE